MVKLTLCLINYAPHIRESGGKTETFLTSALGDGQLHVPAALTHDTESVLTEYENGWAPQPV